MKHSQLLTACSLIGLVAALSLSAVAGAATSRRPNLTVPRASAPAHLELGSTTTLSVTVKNTGSAAAAATNVKLTLSATRRPGRTVLGTARVGALAVGASQVVRVRVAVPSAAAGGSQYVVACADSAARISELNEADNCRASSTHVM